jgi:hypothetical protein
MVRLICALVLVLLITTPSLGQQSLVGTYKLVSLAVETDGKVYQQMGMTPEGYLVLTPTHLITLYAAENRKFGTSVDEKAALLDSMASYAGVYRVEGDKLIYTTEVIWTESGKGATRVETFQLSGNRLTTTLGPMPFPRDLTKTMISRKVWERIE